MYTSVDMDIQRLRQIKCKLERKEKRGFIEVPKGSLTLRSTNKSYGVGVLVDNWRAEDCPKDFDFRTACPRTLSRSTHLRYGCDDDPNPKSVYTKFNEEMMALRGLQYSKKHRDLSTQDDTTYIMIDREKEVACDSGLKYLLPRMSEDPRKFRSLTTNIDFYRPPMPLIMLAKSQAIKTGDKEQEEERAHAYGTFCFKRCISQFADFGGVRREGRHTFEDESGVYANTIYRMSHPLYATREAPYASRLV